MPVKQYFGLTEPFLYDVDSSALVHELRSLDAAYQNFFRRIKKGERPGFPKFKSRYDRKSFTTSNIKKNKYVEPGRPGRIKFPKIGWVEAVVHRPIEGTIVNVTVSCDSANRWWASVSCKDVPRKALPAKDNAVGITMGLSQWIVTSDGEVFDNPRASRKYAKKLAREQRKLSRRQGPTKDHAASKGYEEQRLKVAKLQARIADVRRDATHRATTELVREYGTIVTRDMGVRNMLEDKKRKSWKLNGSIVDANFAEVNRQLEYKAAEAGRTFVKLPASAPTAQTCHDCGHVEKAVKDMRPEWTCSKCGAVHQRKCNGAKNVLDMGLRTLT